ncbi:AAA family ATPase [Corallococcus sp. M7]
MRLRRFYVKSFKNLKRLDISFGAKPPFTVLVGQNGAGKSNLLEALVLVFRNLDLGEPPAFAYTIEYDCRGKRISIDADPSREREVLRIVVDGVPQRGKRFDPELLPNYVFGYYSGPSDRMAVHFFKHQRRFDKALRHGNDQPLRKLFYAEQEHSQFVLLAFYLEKKSKELEHFLRDYLRIERLDSVLFVLKRPDWASAKRAGGDSRFWGAVGKVQELLAQIYKLSLAPLRIDVRTQKDFRRMETAEQLYLYLPDQAALHSVAEAYDSPQDFFKALESMKTAGVLREVRIAVKAKGIEDPITFRELSEGEQQLLMVLGLLRFFTREKESLFLLDEPDTHLNPRWSVEYLDLLQRVAGGDDAQHLESSHLLFCTHNPLVVSSLEKTQVRIMQRERDTGTVLAVEPEEDPKGMGISGILTSDLYGFRAALDVETLRMLDRSRELTLEEKEGSLTPDERKELNDLRNKLQDVDFTRAVRDPLYRPFVEAMTSYEQEQQGPPPSRRNSFDAGGETRAPRACSESSACA